MILQNLKNIKSWIGENKNDLLLAISFFLIALISFALGRISVGLEQKETFPVSIQENGALLGTLTNTDTNNAARAYVGSKNGTVYHLPACSGASRIAEENKIWFSSKEEAENLGYRPAKNCDGI